MTEEEFIKRLREQESAIEENPELDDSGETQSLFATFEEDLDPTTLRTDKLFSKSARSGFSKIGKHEWCGMMSSWDPGEVIALQSLVMMMHHETVPCEAVRNATMQLEVMDGNVKELLGEVSSDVFSFIYNLNRVVNDRGSEFGMASIMREIVMMIYAQSLAPKLIDRGVSWVDFMDAMKVIDQSVTQITSDQFAIFGTKKEIDELIARGEID